MRVRRSSRLPPWSTAQARCASAPLRSPRSRATMPKIALRSLMLVDIWKWYGFHMVIFLAGLAACATFHYGPRPDGRPVPAHHGRRAFVNPQRTELRGFGAFLRWRLGLAPEEPRPIPAAESAVYEPEVLSPDLTLLRRPDPAGIQVTWIGQSTFLVQVEGLNILTDPVFSERASTS